MKRIVPDISFVCSFWLLGFVFAIASAPCDFLYLNNEYMIKKKKQIARLEGLNTKIHLTHRTSSESTATIMTS